MNPPEFDAFVNHFCACKFCKPRHDIYCLGGRNLWIDNQAAFIAISNWIGFVFRSRSEIRK